MPDVDQDATAAHPDRAPDAVIRGAGAVGVAAVGATALAACGGDSSTSTSTAEAPPAAQPRRRTGRWLRRRRGHRQGRHPGRWRHDHRGLQDGRHPAEGGGVQGVHLHLHAHGLPGGARSPTAPSTATATAAVRHRDRRGQARARPQAAGRPKTVTVKGDQRHRHLTGAQEAAARSRQWRLLESGPWQTRRRTVPGRVRSPSTPASTGSATAHGRVIYVGKAKSLRSRLSSYFQDISALHPRTRSMVTTGASVEWTVVSNEVEALQLEYSWIKEFDPRFNVKYRDDKSYPYLAVTMGEEFPRAQVLRGAKRKGTRYFGPYAHAWAIRETLDLLLRVFPMRTCSSGVFKRAGQVGRPCLLGYIDKCSAPCVGRVDADEHRAIAEDFCDFMAGNTGKFVKRLERRMKDAAGGDGLRAGGPAARRHRRAQPRAGEVRGRARRRHRRRRVRPRRGRARGRRPGLPRPRRPGPRPARLGGREGGREHRRGRRAPPPAGVRRRVARGRAARGARARAAARPRPARRSGSAACGGPRSTCGCRSAATRRR